MKIFLLSKKFPSEEKFSLTDQKIFQICLYQFGGSIQKKRYKDYFISKLNDSETENSETQVWLDFCKDCFYISAQSNMETLFLLKMKQQN